MTTLSIFGAITDFLASNPTPEAILDYRLPAELEERALQLLKYKRESKLSFDEALEMHDFIAADDMMSLLKAKIRLKIQ